MNCVVLSMIVIDFEESGERKVMKIGVKVDKRGNERLREQKNEYNRVKETPERAPGTPDVRFMGGQGAAKSSRGWRRLYFRGSGAALSILLRKIQRKQEPKGLRDWCPGSNTPLGRANLSN